MAITGMYAEIMRIAAANPDDEVLRFTLGELEQAAKVPAGGDLRMALERVLHTRHPTWTAHWLEREGGTWLLVDRRAESESIAADMRSSEDESGIEEEEEDPDIPVEREVAPD